MNTHHVAAVGGDDEAAVIDLLMQEYRFTYNEAHTAFVWCGASSQRAWAAMAHIWMALRAVGCRLHGDRQMAGWSVMEDLRNTYADLERSHPVVLYDEMWGTVRIKHPKAV